MISPKGRNIPARGIAPRLAKQRNTSPKGAQYLSGGHRPSTTHEKNPTSPKGAKYHSGGGHRPSNSRARKSTT
jgi:hypothetical protein